MSRMAFVMAVLFILWKIVPIRLPKLIINEDITFVNNKITSSAQQISSIVSSITKNKNELWKTVRPTGFQKPLISSRFYLLPVHLCLLLYSLCCQYLLLTFWVFILSFSQFGKIRDTAALNTKRFLFQIIRRFWLCFCCFFGSVAYISFILKCYHLSRVNFLYLNVVFH